jgi:hypothetical protein
VIVEGRGSESETSAPVEPLIENGRLVTVVYLGVRVTSLNTLALALLVTLPACAQPSLDQAGAASAEGLPHGQLLLAREDSMALYSSVGERSLGGAYPFDLSTGRVSSRRAPSKSPPASRGPPSSWPLTRLH